MKMGSGNYSCLLKQLRDEDIKVITSSTLSQLLSIHDFKSLASWENWDQLIESLILLNHSLKQKIFIGHSNQIDRLIQTIFENLQCQSLTDAKVRLAKIILVVSSSSPESYMEQLLEDCSSQLQIAPSDHYNNSEIITQPSRFSTIDRVEVRREMALSIISNILSLEESPLFTNEKMKRLNESLFYKLIKLFEEARDYDTIHMCISSFLIQGFKKHYQGIERDLKNSFLRKYRSVRGSSLLIISSSNRKISFIFKLLWSAMTKKIIQEDKNINALLCLLCQIFDIFTADKIEICLREQEHFFELIQKGLVSEHSETLKYSSYLLKRMIDFTKYSMNSGVESTKKVQWTKFLKWSAGNHQKLCEVWDTFFLLFETVQEHNTHIIEPLLPKINDLLLYVDAQLIDSSWILMIFNKSIQTHAFPVRKLFLEYVLTCQQHLEKKSYEIFMNIITVEQPEFVLNFLLKHFENATLFAVPGSADGLFSPFGESLSVFIKNCLTNVENSGNMQLLTRWVQTILNFAHDTLSTLSVLYMFQALSSWKNEKHFINQKQAVELCILMDGEKANSIWGKIYARNLIQKYVWRILEKHSDIESIEFTTLCRLIYNYSPNSNHVHASKSFLKFRNWIRSQIKEDFFFETLQKYIKNLMVTETAADPESQRALQWKQIGRTISVFSLSSDNRMQRLNRLLHPIFEKLYNIHQKTYVPHAFKMNLLLFMSIILRELAIFEPELNIAKVFPLFYECIDFVFSLADMYMLDSSHPLSDAFVFHDFLSLLCVGFKIAPPVKHVFDQVSKKNDILFIRPLLLNIFPSFKILELMDSWRQRAIHTVNKSTELKQLMQGLLVLKVCLNSEISLAHGEQPSKPPLSGVQLHQLLMKLMQIAEQSCRDEIDGYSRRWIKNQLHILKYHCFEAIFTWNGHFKLNQESTFMQTIISDVMADLEKASEDTAAPVFELLHCAVNSFPNFDAKSISQSNLKRISDCAVDILTSLWAHSKFYYQAFASAVEFFLHPTILRTLNHQNSISIFIKKILRDSEYRTGLMPRVAYHLYMYLIDQVLPASDEEINDAYLREWFRCYTPIIVDCLIYGPARDKDRDDQRHDAIYAFKIQDGEHTEDISENENTAAWNLSSQDFMVRVHLNDFMMRLDSKNQVHVYFASLVIEQLVGKHLSIRVRYPQTIEHRQSVKSFCQPLIKWKSDDRLFFFKTGMLSDVIKRVRVWCSVHSCLHILEEEKSEFIFKKIIECIDHETVVSTRYYIEWALARILIQYPHLFGQFWRAFADFKLRAQNISSFLTVSMAVGPLVPKDYQREWYSECIQKTLPWSNSHHFTIRLFSQISLIRATEYCYKNDIAYYGEEFEHQQFKSTIQFLKENPDSLKHRKKIINYYFISDKFHPLRDVNIEFIFYKGLEFAGIMDTERIHPMVFEKLKVQIKGNSKRFIPLTESSDNHENDNILELADSKEDDDNKGANEEGEEEKRSMSVKNQTSADVTELETVQKKIMPWQDMFDTDLFFTLDMMDYGRQKRQPNPFIVVASLISRVPNLAGLCRTCEIFNAESLVLNNLKIKDDPQFQGISVTSDLWLPLVEVKENSLKDYLLEKKKDGYTLVGVEQTTTSVPLQSFVFPKKTVLLLGKEREGIPADLLSIMEKVVEIPQFGVIRSLNVHVSGAICIWEYTKQQID